MTVFQSQLEQLMPAEELLFDATPGFGRYKSFMEQAIAHPAKMNTRLLEYLIKSHTKEGDMILDPMSGTGSTGIVSALNGRNAICVELEEKFFGWMEEAHRKIESSQILASKGKIVNIKGDARHLSKLLVEADVVLTSPPYSNAISKQGGFSHLKQVGISTKTSREYSGKPENLGNLAHGNIDTVITSPPYSETLSESKNTTSNLKREERLRTSGHEPKQFMGGKARDCQLEDGLRYSHTFDNIGNLKHGEVDAVITSPPYAEVVHSTGQTREKVIEMLRKKGYSEAWIQAHYMGPYCQVKETGYSENPENIGNLGFVDNVITSPPYEQSLEGGTRHYQKGGGHFKIIDDKKLPTAYSFQNEAQIGNLKKETYLEAMLKVYSEMWKVLKIGGSTIIVIKPFIRNKKVVDLPWHTWLLLKKVGFKLSKVYKLRLKQDSFWRVLYKQKYPEVSQIKHEYILVCQKSPSFYAKGEKMTNLFHEKDLKLDFQFPQNKPQNEKQAQIGKTEIAENTASFAEICPKTRESSFGKSNQIYDCLHIFTPIPTFKITSLHRLLRWSCKTPTVNRL